LGKGIRSVANVVTLPDNDFEVLDKSAIIYDDKRTCCVCKVVCMFSAIVCECSTSRVACVRPACESSMCKCLR
jgi:hypothetical protein